jgi:hypothetical protein
MEAHHGAVESHHGAMEAHQNALEVHHDRRFTMTPWSWRRGLTMAVTTTDFPSQKHIYKNN